MNSLTPTPIVDRNGRLTTVYKKFKATLSGKSAIPVPSIAPASKNITPTTPFVLNTVTRSENGGFEVSVDDPQAGLVTLKFGDLIKNQESAEMLQQADPKKKYQLGDCAVIASELWHANEHVSDYAFITTESDSESGIHHFVRLKDGTCVDSQGLWTEEALLKNWQEIDPTSEISDVAVDGAEIVNNGEVITRNPSIEIDTPELFNTLQDLIEQHINR